jgi:hypothetical protein
MTRVDLNEDRREVLVRTLRDIIAADPFPLSPRIAADARSSKRSSSPRRGVEAFQPPRQPAEPLGKTRR